MKKLKTKNVEPLQNIKESDKPLTIMEGGYYPTQEEFEQEFMDALNDPKTVILYGKEGLRAIGLKV